MVLCALLRKAPKFILTCVTYLQNYKDIFFFQFPKSFFVNCASGSINVSSHDSLIFCLLGCSLVSCLGFFNHFLIR